MRQSKREHGDLYTWKLTIYVGSKAKGPKSVRKMMAAIQYVLVKHDPLARSRGTLLSLRADREGAPSVHQQRAHWVPVRSVRAAQRVVDELVPTVLELLAPHLEVVSLTHVFASVVSRRAAAVSRSAAEHLTSLIVML